MSGISRFEVDHWDGDDRAILRKAAGMKRCRKDTPKDGTYPKHAIAGRAMKGPEGPVCPACADCCLLPAPVKPGDLFLILSVGV
jgi:hypothetical protein